MAAVMPNFRQSETAGRRQINWDKRRRPCHISFPARSREKRLAREQPRVVAVAEARHNAAL